MNHLVKPPDRLYPRHRSNSRQAPLRPTAEAQARAAGVAAGEDADAEVEAGARSPTAEPNQGLGIRDWGLEKMSWFIRIPNPQSPIPYRRLAC